jgi:hypothetical protein
MSEINKNLSHHSLNHEMHTSRFCLILYSKSKNDLLRLKDANNFHLRK